MVMKCHLFSKQNVIVYVYVLCQISNLLLGPPRTYWKIRIFTTEKSISYREHKKNIKFPENVSNEPLFSNEFGSFHMKNNRC